MAKHPFDQRMAQLITTGRRFTADDLTDAGRLALDPHHEPNAGQNGVGAYMQHAVRQRRITWTGGVMRSQAPHRKGGTIRVWTGTNAGRQWAMEVLSPNDKE